MRIIQIIESVLKEQEERFQKIPVDIKLTNGNILLRSFRIYGCEWKEEVLKGLTFQEEYAHAREGRDPVFCFLKLEEIKELIVPELGFEYSKEPILIKV